jgi:hypothetical protein
MHRAMLFINVYLVIYCKTDNANTCATFQGLVLEL